MKYTFYQILHSLRHNSEKKKHILTQLGNQHHHHELSCDKVQI